MLSFSAPTDNNFFIRLAHNYMFTFGVFFVAKNKWIKLFALCTAVYYFYEGKSKIPTSDQPVQSRKTESATEPAHFFHSLIHVLFSRYLNKTLCILFSWKHIDRRASKKIQNEKKFNVSKRSILLFIEYSIFEHRNSFFRLINWKHVARDWFLLLFEWKSNWVFISARFFCLAGENSLKIVERKIGQCILSDAGEKGEKGKWFKWLGENGQMIYFGGGPKNALQTSKIGRKNSSLLGGTLVKPFTPAYTCLLILGQQHARR